MLIHICYYSLVNRKGVGKYLGGRAERCGERRVKIKRGTNLVAKGPTKKSYRRNRIQNKDLYLEFIHSNGAAFWATGSLKYLHRIRFNTSLFGKHTYFGKSRESRAIIMIRQ